MHLAILSTNQPHIPSSSAPNQGTEEHTGAYQPHQPLIAQRVFTVQASLYTLIESLLDPQSFTYFSTVNKTCAQHDRDVWAKRFRVYAAKNPRVLELTLSEPNPKKPLPFKNLYFQFEKLTFSSSEDLLNRAINEGCTEVVSLLIARNPHIVNADYNSPLEIAVKMKQLEIVRMLTQHSNQNVQEKAVDQAILDGDTDTVGILLSGNIKLIENSKYLCSAINYKNIGMVKRLLDCKANIESRSYPNYKTPWQKDLMIAPPLIYAIRDLHEHQTDYRIVGIVKILLEYKANLNPAGDYPTALMCASEAGNVTIVNLLLMHARKTIGIPAVIHATNSAGETALMRALHSGHPEVLGLLMSHKADIHQANRDGKTGLMYALRHSKQAVSTKETSLLKFLLACKADVNHADAQGQTPLMYAVRFTAAYSHWSPEYTQILLEHNANVNMVDKQGKTALIHGSSGELTTEGVKLLLNHRADVSIVDHAGKTAIMYAQQSSWKEGQRRLLQAAMESAAK